ncbi:MAG TPA: universal stress protein [Gaiellaceae bacterium]|nr:universal stress protein [Gaiellaceae bacterium]
MAVRALQARPRHALAYRRILVPLVPNLESETAMALAAELAEDRGSSITAVVVVEVSPELPLEAHMLDEEAQAKRTLDDAHAIGNARGVHVHTRTLRARQAGEAIVEEAERSRADLVVLRAPRQNGRRKIFGKTVDYVLRHAPCRVMVAAPPSPACARPTPLS